MTVPIPVIIDGLPTLTIAGSGTGSLNTASTIDAVNDYLSIYTASATATQGINRNTLLGLSSAPLGLTDTQSVSNKTLGNTNTVTIQDTNFTIQDNGDTTKQLKFQLSGITTATTRTLTVPDASDTITTIAATQTLTNKTLTSPTINTATISNPTLTVDTVSGFSTSTIVSVAGLSISAGVLNTNNSVKTSNYQSASVTAAKIASFDYSVATVADPYKFSAYLSAATQTASTGDKITFDVTDYDTNTNFASNTYTAAVNGFYHFDAAVYVSSASTTTSIQLYKNASPYKQLTLIGSSSGDAVLTGSADIQLVATDTVSVHITFSGGGTRTIQNITAGQRLTWFNGRLTSQT